MNQKLAKSIRRSYKKELQGEVIANHNAIWQELYDKALQDRLNARLLMFLSLIVNVILTLAVVAILTIR